MATQLPYSCLENSMDRGAWWATVHAVTKSQTQLKQLSNVLLSTSNQISLRISILHLLDLNFGHGDTLQLKQSPSKSSVHCLRKLLS